MSTIKIDTSSAVFYFKDGILICELKPDLIIDLKTSKDIALERQRICEGQPYPMLTLVHKNYLLMDKDAFRFFGSEEGVSGLLASALVIDTPLQNLLTNFSLFFYKQSVPFRLFTAQNEAQLWLFKYIRQELLAEH